MKHERQILDQVLAENSPQDTSTMQPPTLTTQHDILDARKQVQQIFISDAVRDYIVRITGATRGHGMGALSEGDIAHAASPRATINLALAARARAWLHKRQYVDPDDIAALAPDILCGRIVLDYPARAAGISERDMVKRILESTPRVLSLIHI